MKDLGYSPEQREEMRKISDRLFQLQSLKEEETAAAILEALGKLKRPYLTAMAKLCSYILKVNLLGGMDGTLRPK